MFARDKHPGLLNQKICAHEKSFERLQSGKQTTLFFGSKLMVVTSSLVQYFRAIEVALTPLYGSGVESQQPD